jgi:phosphoserine phosphatase
MSTLPQAMPVLAGYDVHGTFRPALLTGGDTFDLAPVGDGLLVVLGDATGHGIAPALSVTQMHAMLRMAFRLGADLETAFAQVNDLLAETLAEDRFVTAFIGVLDPRRHVVRYISAGQGPILHFHADAARCSAPQADQLSARRHGAAAAAAAAEMTLRPATCSCCCPTAIYEYANGAGEQFGEDRVEHVVAGHRPRRWLRSRRAILEAVQAFAAVRPGRRHHGRSSSGARRRRERACRVRAPHRRLGASSSRSRRPAFARHGRPRCCRDVDSFSRSSSPTSSSTAAARRRWRSTSRRSPRASR